MRRYEDEFKLMIVQKNKEGESITNLSKEFNIGMSTVHKWVKMYRDSKSFKEVNKLFP